MKTQAWICAAVAAILIGNLVQAQERRLFGRKKCPPPCDVIPEYPAGPSLDRSQPPADSTAQPPQSDAFNEALASAGEGGTQPAAGYMPGMFGDIIGGQIRTGVNLGGSGFTVVGMPNPSQNAGFKIAENDSPRPTNRVYYNYNYFGNIDVSLGDPGVPFLQVNRHTVGVEKTFFHENASVGLRIPFLTFAGDPGYESRFTGDLSIITKYAILNNPDTGNIFSVGLVIGTPTGGTPLLGVPGQQTVLPRIFDVTLQPFFGYIYSISPSLYVHGFHSVAVPTDFNDVTFMSNDVGVGYWLYRNPDGVIQGIVPTVEIHVNTPFTHRDPAGNVFMIDQTTLTAGGYFVLARATFGGAVGVPFTGPHQIEAVASCTLRF